MADSQEDHTELSNADRNIKATAGEAMGISENVHRRAQDELRRVEQIVSELTGLPSNWNGKVDITLEQQQWQ